MITRPHICLRCQYRLAKRSIPPRKQVLFQSIHARPQRSSIVADEYQDEDEFHHTRRPLRLSRRPLAAQKNLSEHPLGKLYGYTGQQQRENREKLDIDVLGEAAEVIVLRDSKFSKYTLPIEEYVETQEGIDILAKLDEQRGLVGWEEVETNINEFKPEDGEEPQTILEFSQLLTELQSGFTVAQLARYLQAHAQPDKKAPELSSTSAILRISPWVPGISESDEHLDQNHLRGYDLDSYTSKQRMVLRILRECWRLELPFVEEGVGQVEVELKPRDLELLLKGASSALSAIHSKHIVERGERLESFKSNDVKQSRNAIRITTTRIKSYAIVRDIEETLKGIHQINISLKDLMPPSEQGKKLDTSKWMKTHFDGSVIEEVARLTSADIERSGGTLGSSLSITSVEPYWKSLTNRTDIARRLLLSSAVFSERQKNWVGCKEMPNAVDGIMVPYPSTEGLSWRERLRQWKRWTAPTPKEVEKKNAIPRKAEVGQNAKGLLPIANTPIASRTTTSNSPRDPHSSKLLGADISAHWDGPNDFGVQSSAIVGHILHSHFPTSTRSKEDAPLSANSIRSFSTVVSNTSKILTGLVGNPYPTEAVLMRFLPNPFQANGSKTSMSSGALSAFPPVEIRFGVHTRTKKLYLLSITAVLSSENSDLMLPDSPTDIRFQQRSVANLHFHRDNLLSGLPSGLAKFLEESNLTLDFLAGKGGLTMPPSLTIPIPSHLCGPPGFQLLSPDAKDTKTQEIPYLFTGLEVRRTLSLNFEGWRLLYTSVEAGKAGGRRSELQLRTHRVESGDPSKETVEAFLESAFRLADGGLTPIEITKTMNSVLSMTPSAGVNSKPVSRPFRYFGKRPSNFDKPDPEDRWMADRPDEF